MIDLSTIQYKHFNERDLEHPALVNFIKQHPDITAALDVGCHWSWSYYAEDVRKLIPNYDGIDILPDEKTENIVNKYYVDNVLNLKNVKYDLVFSVSSIEHAGISTYKVEDYLLERLHVFNKILDLSRKYVFLTFPFGKVALHENEFANITFGELDAWKANAKSLGFKKWNTVFYFSEAPQQKQPYKEVDLEFASNIEYKRELGTRCVCMLSIEKL